MTHIPLGWTSGRVFSDSGADPALSSLPFIKSDVRPELLLHWALSVADKTSQTQTEN